MVILRELDTLAAYHYRLKIAHEEKIRRRFAKDATNDEEAALMDSVAMTLNIDETMMQEGGEGDEESEDDTDDEEEEERIQAVAAKNQEPVKSWKGKDNEQAGTSDEAGPSESKGRSSLDRLRGSMDFGRNKPSAPEAPADDSGKRSARPQTAMASKKKRKLRKDPTEDIEFPELKVLPGLRPIMVEMVSRSKVLGHAYRTQLIQMSSLCRSVLCSSSTECHRWLKLKAETDSCRRLLVNDASLFSCLFSVRMCLVGAYV